MCRALQVVCVAGGRPSLTALKKAVASMEWELTPGATDTAAALDQIDERKAHVLVAWGAFDDLIREARDRSPTLRIVAVGMRDFPGADVVVRSIREVRGAILGQTPPGGPVRS